MTIDQSGATIADVQNSPDTRQLPIDQVGIKHIRHPVRVQDRSGNDQHTVATFNMYVDLPHNFKGTHMSRFVELLNAHEREITVASFKDILHRMRDVLGASSAHLEMRFPWFVSKAAPVSGVRSMLDYEVALIGEATAERIKQEIGTAYPSTAKTKKVPSARFAFFGYRPPFWAIFQTLGNCARVSKTARGLAIPR